MQIHRVILNDGTEKTGLEAEEIRVLYQAKSVSQDSLIQLESNGKWCSLGDLINLSEWERDSYRFNVICSNGTEQSQIGFSHLKELYQGKFIKADSPVFDSCEGRWLPLSHRFELTNWNQKSYSANESFHSIRTRFADSSISVPLQAHATTQGVDTQTLKKTLPEKNNSVNKEKLGLGTFLIVFGFYTVLSENKGLPDGIRLIKALVGSVCAFWGMWIHSSSLWRVIRRR